MRFKILSIAALAIISIAPVSACAQTLGVRASWDISVPHNHGSFYKSGSGFNVGAVYKIGLPQNVYFEPGIGVEYSSMNTKKNIQYQGYGYTGAAKLWSIDVPFNFGYTFHPLTGLDVDLFTGPEVNFYLSARQSLQPNFASSLPIPEGSVNLFKQGWKRVGLLWKFGLGLTFAKDYYIGLSGGVAVSPLAKYGNKEKKEKLKRNIVAITLGYNF